MFREHLAIEPTGEVNFQAANAEVLVLMAEITKLESHPPGVFPPERNVAAPELAEHELWVCLEEPGSGPRTRPHSLVSMVT